MFEQRLFDLAGILHKITGPLIAEHVPHELIDGLAVLVHVEEAAPEHSALTAMWTCGAHEIERFSGQGPRPYPKHGRRGLNHR